MIDSRKTRVRIPNISSLETAIKKYYEKTELSNSDIKEIFDVRSSATVAKLKQVAKQEMIEQNTPCWNAQRVNTEVAYRVWGIDIEDIERRYKKLKEFSA